MPPTPLPARLSERLERLDAFTEAVADYLAPKDAATLRRLVRACMTLWERQREGIDRARLALGYGGQSAKLRRLDRRVTRTCRGV